MPKPRDKKKHTYMFTDDIKFLQKAIVLHPKKKNYFLIIKRSPDAFSRPDCWDLPGGNVLFGELHEPSLKKEIHEETGQKIPGPFMPIQVSTFYDNQKRFYRLFIGYACKASGQTIRVSSEHTEGQWVSPTQFFKLTSHPYLEEFVRIYFKKQK